MSGAGRAGALAAGLALVACSVQRALVEERADPARQGEAPRVVAVPIDNFAVVADGIYRGAQPGSDGWKALKELGVKTVVNLREHHSDASAADSDAGRPLRFDGAERRRGRGFP